MKGVARLETKQVTSDKSKRLVDAMQIVTRLSKRISVLILLGGTPAEVYDEVLKVIAEAPTEDAAPVVHGEWIERPDLCSLLSNTPAILYIFLLYLSPERLYKYPLHIQSK